jgi:AcrR family transcriptional regulator
VTPDPLPPQPWRRPDRAGRRQLSTELIVNTALDLLATEGLEAVTMRKVAQRLDTGAASLYAHVRNKADLHELMLDAVMRDVAVPEPDPARWKQQLKELGLDITAALAARPGIARIALETLIPTTPNVLDLMDKMLGILRAGGLSEEDVLSGADVLALYTAAGAYEQALQSTERMTRDAASRIEQITNYLDLVPTGRLPHLAALAPAMANSRASYALGLELIIEGLAARTAD